MQDFNKFVTNFVKDDSTSCSGMSEVEYRDEAGKTGYQTVLKNTCPNGWTEFTINMSISDWEGLEFLYQSHDDYQELVHNTVLSGCQDAGADRKCTLHIGEVENWSKLGLPSKNQPVMGWRNGAGAWGIKGSSAKRYTY